MIPAGFMAKKVRPAPEWLKAGAALDVYSVSNCLSEAFCDYSGHWKHNGYWLFDSPAAIHEVAQAESVDLSECAVFYYEVHEQQFDERRKIREWFGPLDALETRVAVPEARQLEGYDVVSVSGGNAPECSPLSCNGLASSIPVNRHCLLASLDEAKDLLERDVFVNCEPGPYRVFAVFSCAAT